MRDILVCARKFMTYATRFTVSYNTIHAIHYSDAKNRLISQFAHVAQWIARRPPKAKVMGSNPILGTFLD